MNQPLRIHEIAFEDFLEDKNKVFMDLFPSQQRLQNAVAAEHIIGGNPGRFGYSNVIKEKRRVRKLELLTIRVFSIIYRKLDRL
jgi:hypothetical protein